MSPTTLAAYAAAYDSLSSAGLGGPGAGRGLDPRRGSQSPTLSSTTGYSRWVAAFLHCNLLTVTGLLNGWSEKWLWQLLLSCLLCWTQGRVASLCMQVDGFLAGQLVYGVAVPLQLLENRACCRPHSRLEAYC